MTKPKNRGGRPRTREPQPGQRITISVRLTARLKALLAEAAERSGRSLSQEAEFLIEKALGPEPAFATEEQWAYVLERTVLVSDLMTRMGAHLLSKASEAKDPAGIEEAKGFETHAKAILESFPPGLVAAVRKGRAKK